MPSPHLYDAVPLSVTAKTAGVSTRTVRRWLAGYRADGAAALVRPYAPDGRPTTASTTAWSHRRAVPDESTGAPSDRAGRQTRLAAAALGHDPDPRDTQLNEPTTPPPHRIRVHPAPPPDLVVGNPVTGPQQRASLLDLSLQQRGRHRHPLQLDPLLNSHRQSRSNHATSTPHNQINSPTDH